MGKVEPTGMFTPHASCSVARHAKGVFMVDKRIYSVAVAALSLCSAVVAAYANLHYGKQPFDGGVFALLGILLGLFNQIPMVVLEIRSKTTFSGLERAGSFILSVLLLAIFISTTNGINLSAVAWGTAGFFIVEAAVRLMSDMFSARRSN